MRFFGASSADVYVCGKRVKVDPTASVGKGGEADVFDIGRGLALIIPASPTGQYRRKMLTEKAGDVPPRRREAVIHD